MKLAIIAIPVADAPTLKTDAEGNEYRSFDPPARQEAWDKFVRRYNKIGRAFNSYFIVDCLMRESFITAGEATAENPETNLPAGWVNAHTVRIHNQGRTTYTYTDLPDIIIPAVDITDDTFPRTEIFSRHYVRPQYNNTDPENPVLLGVYLLDRMFNNIDADFLYPIDGLQKDGGYIRTYTEPAKLVTHVGSGQSLLVREEELEANGTYIYKRQTKTVKQAAYEELVPKHAQLIEWARDMTEGGRPSEFAEEFRYGDMEAGRFA